MYICICIYVCVYVFVYLYMYVDVLWICMYICIRMYAYACIYVYKYVYIVYRYVYMYMYAYMYVYAYVSEKATAPHSSTLAWKIPMMEEPGGLQSMGSLRVGHNWTTSLSLFTFMHWRRKWQPTPLFLSGESQGRESLVGCHLWGRTESDTTEAT